MIKNLISDLIYNKIKLSEALTRSKLVALEVDSDNFRVWLKKELEGYEHNDRSLPSYRTTFSPCHLAFVVNDGKEISFPIFAPEDVSEEDKNVLETYRFTDSITVLEKQIEEVKTSTVRFNYPSKNNKIFYPFLTTRQKAQIKIYNARISNAYREVGKLSLVNVVEMTKQKLIDTLADFHREFPDLMDNFEPSKKNNEKLQNIVTTNIYGGTNPMNVAVGDNIKQSDITFNITKQDREKLKSYGVNDDQIKDLETINIETPKGSPKRKERIMLWLGQVTASLASKGIYEHVPELVDFIGKLI